jgi:hypothetical protein
MTELFVLPEHTRFFLNQKVDRGTINLALRLHPLHDQGSNIIQPTIQTALTLAYRPTKYHSASSGSHLMTRLVVLRLNEEMAVAGLSE